MTDAEGSLEGNDLLLASFPRTGDCRHLREEGENREYRQPILKDRGDARKFDGAECSTAKILVDVHVTYPLQSAFFSV